MREITPEQGKDQTKENPLFHKLWLLFFNSYRFSQGRPTLQHEIFRWLHLTYPEFTVDSQLKKDLRAVAVKKIPKYAQSSRLHTEKVTDNTIHASISHETKKLFDTLQSPLPATREELESEKKDLVQKIAGTMIEIDHRYLVKEGRRPRGEATHDRPPNTPTGDPFLSQICFYGFGRGVVQPEEYRVMWNEITTWIRKNLVEVAPPKDQYQNYLQRQLYDVIRSYEEKHPETKVVLTESEIEKGPIV